MRGEWPDSGGFKAKQRLHRRCSTGRPGGVVYLDLSKGLQEDWSVSLSHEALEMIADPQVNLVVQGPHPAGRDRDVFHWYEMCDAMRAQAYTIDGIGVSDFVLPLYFTPSSEPGSRNNFRGCPRRLTLLGWLDATEALEIDLDADTAPVRTLRRWYPGSDCS